MKGLVWILLLFLLIGSVSATKFDENTTFSQDNINYVFVEGLEVDSFQIHAGGIKINDAKIGFTVEGGELTVTIYEFDIFDKRIGILSSVPQKVQFVVTDKGVRQYLYDQESYHLNDYNIGTDEVIFEFVDVEETYVEKGDIQNIESLPWYKQKIVEFEISTEINNGIITGQTVAITYLWFTIAIVAIVVIFMVRWAMT